MYLCAFDNELKNGNIYVLYLYCTVLVDVQYLKYSKWYRYT